MQGHAGKCTKEHQNGRGFGSELAAEPTAETALYTIVRFWTSRLQLSPLLSKLAIKTNLDTVGVTGSNPVPRTTVKPVSPDIQMICWHKANTQHGAGKRTKKHDLADFIGTQLALK